VIAYLRQFHLRKRLAVIQKIADGDAVGRELLLDDAILIHITAADAESDIINKMISTGNYTFSRVGVTRNGISKILGLLVDYFKLKNANGAVNLRMICKLMHMESGSPLDIAKKIAASCKLNEESDLVILLRMIILIRKKYSSEASGKRKGKKAGLRQVRKAYIANSGGKRGKEAADEEIRYAKDLTRWYNNGQIDSWYYEAYMANMGFGADFANIYAQLSWDADLGDNYARQILRDYDEELYEYTMMDDFDSDVEYYDEENEDDFLETDYVTFGDFYDAPPGYSPEGLASIDAQSIRFNERMLDNLKIPDDFEWTYYGPYPITQSIWKRSRENPWNLGIALAYNAWKRTPNRFRFVKVDDPMKISKWYAQLLSCLQAKEEVGVSKEYVGESNVGLSSYRAIAGKTEALETQLRILDKKINQLQIANTELSRALYEREVWAGVSKGPALSVALEHPRPNSLLLGESKLVQARVPVPVVRGGNAIPILQGIVDTIPPAVVAPVVAAVLRESLQPVPAVVAPRVAAVGSGGGPSVEQNISKRAQLRAAKNKKKNLTTNVSVAQTPAPQAVVSTDPSVVAPVLPAVKGESKLPGVIDLPFPLVERHSMAINEGAVTLKLSAAIKAPSFLCNATVTKLGGETVILTTRHTFEGRRATDTITFTGYGENQRLTIQLGDLDIRDFEGPNVDLVAIRNTTLSSFSYSKMISTRKHKPDEQVYIRRLCAHSSTGLMVSIGNVKSPLGPATTVTYNSEVCACGAPVCNEQGHLLGIHVGTTGTSNVFASVTENLRIGKLLFQKESPPPAQ